MAFQNALNCTNYAPNQGVGTCMYYPAPWLGLIAIKKGRKFTASELNTFLATITTALTADLVANRIYWLGQFNTITPDSNDPTTQDLDDGARFYPRDPVWNLSAVVVNSSACQDKNLQKFNNAQKAYDFLIVDKNLRVLGQNSVDNITGLQTFSGVEFQNIYVMPQTLAVPTAMAQSQINFNLLNVKAFQANLAIADLSNTALLSVLSMNGGGIQDVILTKTAALATSISFVAKGNCGNDDLGGVTGYAAVGNFDLYNETDGAAVTITAVSVTGTYPKVVTVTFATQTGDTVTLKQKAPSVLNSATGLWLETPLYGQIQVTLP